MPPDDDSSASYSRDQKVIEHRLNGIDHGQERIWQRLDEMGTDLTAIKTQLKIEPRLRGGMFGVAGGNGDSGAGNGDTSAPNTTGAGTLGSAGTANRGGGGGGGCGRNGFSGGLGVVIVRFPTQTRTYQSLQAFANDGAAATGGVLVGEFYRDSSTAAVRQRVS